MSTHPRQYSFTPSTRADRRAPSTPARWPFTSDARVERAAPLPTPRTPVPVSSIAVSQADGEA